MLSAQGMWLGECRGFGALGLCNIQGSGIVVTMCCSDPVEWPSPSSPGLELLSV